MSSIFLSGDIDVSDNIVFTIQPVEKDFLVMQHGAIGLEIVLTDDKRRLSIVFHRG